MPGHDTIAVAGRITEVLGPGLFRAELANGHRVLAHPTRQTRPWAGEVLVGDEVRLELSPFDMSTARLVGRTAGPAVAEGAGGMPGQVRREATENLDRND